MRSFKNDLSFKISPESLEKLVQLLSEQFLSFTAIDIYKKFAKQLLKKMSDHVAEEAAKYANAVKTRNAGKSLARQASLFKAKLRSLGVTTDSLHLLETFVGTQRQAVQQAKLFQLSIKDDNVWGYRYRQIERPTKRETHVPLDGVTLIKSDPFWKVYWPPNGWNCGCFIELLYEKERQRRPRGQIELPEEGFDNNLGALLISENK